MTKYNLGLVLSGGGVRGIAHAGVLQALNELHIKVDIISGTSSGALIGVLYSAGVDPHETVKYVKKNKLFDISGLSFNFKGLMKPSVFRTILKKYVNQSKFEDLSVPLTVCVTDFTHGKPVYFNSGPLAEVVVASCSIPFIFPPVLIDNSALVDGGLLDNFPVYPIQDKCKNILGIHVNPFSTFNNKSFKRKLERTFQLAISSSISQKREKCNVFLEPKKLSQYSVFDSKNAEAIYIAGYEEVMNNKSEILKLAE